jgi:hypothetical protein
MAPQAFSSAPRTSVNGAYIWMTFASPSTAQTAEVVDRVAQVTPDSMAEIVWVRLGVVAAQWTIRGGARTVRGYICASRPRFRLAQHPEYLCQVLAVLVVHFATVEPRLACSLSSPEYVSAILVNYVRRQSPFAPELQDVRVDLFWVRP